MKNLFIVRWLRNVSISRKLYFTVGLMALLIAMELGTLMFAIKTLSSVRALVGAEGLWSKAQKDAAYSLQKYGRSHDEKDYREFLNFLKVPLGDRKTRLELLKQAPDMEVARSGFLEGRFHPNDIDGAIDLFRRFHSIYYIDKAARIWAKGDTLISGFLETGEELHRETTAPVPSAERINIVLSRIDPINDSLTHIEDEFSYTLGEGSRWLSDLILKLLLSLVLTVEVCGLSVTILVSRGIARGLNNIIQSSEKIAAGDFSGRAKVFSQDEIGILANSFNEMTDKLQLNIDALKRSEEALIASKEVAEQSAIVKEHFLANMSHEIRTPMNAVIGFANLLENTTLDDHQQQFVNAIKISGQNLMAIINDILDYSKIESGKIIIEQIPFSITHVFEGVRVLMSRKAVEKRLELKVSVDAQIPGTLLGDPMRLTQVLLNLTDNALKFTEKGEVALSATMVKTTDQAITVQFRIADTGVGIVPEKLPIIFDRFTQGSTETTRKHGGTGLGLSIAQSLVDLQGGNIAVESKIGQGTVFAFSITYTRAKPEQTMVTVNKKRDQVVERAEPIWVLLAEDNPVNQSLVVYVLKKSGIETDIADNGAIAIEKMKSGNYDLVLMDIQMPEMDGYEATSIIRKELHSNIPIIALTAHALNEEKEKCLRLGMNDYLSKPFDPKELYNKIVAACAA